MLLLTVPAAVTLILPKLFQDFSGTLLATVLFSSNVWFWRRSANYFAGGTELDPLLHTWSLAVEEQFYIVFPIYLALFRAFTRLSKLRITLALLGLSFALNVWSTKNAPTAAFYLAPARAWELLMGAAVALSNAPAATGPQRPLFRGAGSAIGLLLVVGSLLALDPEIAFPGFAAVAPCLGTAMVIHFGRSGTNRTAQLLLSLRPLVFIGKISYSLYLWHWPLIVFIDKYGLFGKPSLSRRLAVVAGAVLVATLSWRYVEEPFRRGKRVTRRKLFLLAAASMTVLAAGGAFGVWSDGWPSRFPGFASVSMAKQEAAEAAAAAREHGLGEGRARCFVADRANWEEDKCFLTRRGPENVLLWGDSFAAGYDRGFWQNTDVAGSVLQYTSPQCPPIRGYYAASFPACSAFNEGLEDVLKRYNIKAVIMVGSWSSYLRRRKISYADISATVNFLRALKLKVILVGQGPHFAFWYPDEYFYSEFGAELGAWTQVFRRGRRGWQHQQRIAEASQTDCVLRPDATLL